MQSDRTTVVGDTLFTLRGRAARAHNFVIARNAAATFQALPGAGFLVNGATVAPDAAPVSAGAEIAQGVSYLGRSVSCIDKIAFALCWLDGVGEFTDGAADIIDGALLRDAHPVLNLCEGHFN